MLLAGAEPFTYESMTIVRGNDAWMEGYFEFTTPGEDRFRAAVPRFNCCMLPYEF